MHVMPVIFLVISVILTGMVVRDAGTVTAITVRSACKFWHAHADYQARISGREHVLVVAGTVYQLRIVALLVFGERRTLRASFLAAACGGPAFQVLAVLGGA